MTPLAALLAFALAAGLLTLTPGLDTILVLRTAAAEGSRAGIAAAGGIGLGCLLWGAAVALGLGALLGAAPAAYHALTWAGAAYLVWIGLALLWRPRRALAEAGEGPVAPASAAAAFRRGVLTNLLNPKIGVFYISFLPQFVPAGFAAGPTVFALAAGHVLIGLAWLSALALGTARLAPVLRRPAVVGALDRVTGAVFVLFGAKLVLSRAG